jgi:2-polyprenyl-6-methoxyphenol hydroxylase-like FAD-dependent oxidoreductase
VAIVGGGFGGLFAARALRGAEVEVTVVDRPTITSFSDCSTRWRPGL